jgi:hypothetical protein
LVEEEADAAKQKADADAKKLKGQGLRVSWQKSGQTASSKDDEEVVYMDTNKVCG